MNINREKFTHKKMTELLGKSVGEWSANEYANFGMPIGIPQGTIGRDRLQRALEEGRRAQIALGLRNEAIARAENQAGQQINRDSSTGDVTVNRSGIDLGGSANTGMSDAVDLPQRIRLNPKRLPKRIQKKSVVLDASSDTCLLYTSPSPRDRTRYRMPSSA